MSAARGCPAVRALAVAMPRPLTAESSLPVEVGPLVAHAAALRVLGAADASATRARVEVR